MSTKATILTVEDDPGIQKIYQQILDAEDYLVIQADNGKEALEILSVCIPDLIILDWCMPQMNGQQFLSALIHQRKIGICPILVCTANPDYSLFALDMGATEFMSKPFELQDFIDIVESLLARRLASCA